MTREDICDIQYFHTYKGDITRWMGWEDNLDNIRFSHPELIKAMQDANAAERILDIVVDNLEIKI